MRLGNILKQKGGTPETGRPVRFQLRQKQSGTKQGNSEDEKTTRVTYSRLWAEAILLPVSASEVSTIQADVSDYIAENPGAIRDDEINLRFLAAALHDSENQGRRFVFAEELQKFSDALTVPQIAWLLLEYQQMMRTEYPECWASAEQREKGEEEAEDFSEDGQD